MGFAGTQYYIHWEVDSTTGATTNGGGFDPSQTAGMNTDGAATLATSSAPVFSSASYNFVSGDVGAWVYIASGTNWTAGWYKITSVASNNATLNATAGQYNLAGKYQDMYDALGTTTGCATTASPSAATWTIDYSQQAAAQVAFTDLVIGSTTTQLTSSAHPFGKQWVGNLIQISTNSGGWTTGWWCIASVSGTTATMTASVGTASSTGGNGSLGGALATASLNTLFTSGATIPLLGNNVYMKGTFTITATWAISAAQAGRISIRGYSTYRNDAGRAVITCATNSVNCITFYGANSVEFNYINFTCTAGTPGYGTYQSGANAQNIVFNNCMFSGWQYGIDGDSSASGYSIQPLYLIAVEVKNSVSYGVINSTDTYMTGCWLHNNGSDGFQINYHEGGMLSAINCVSSNNGGKGFYNNAGGGTVGFFLQNCTAYTNTSDGVTCSSSEPQIAAINCIFYGNGGYGINYGGSPPAAEINIGINNAFGSNTSGNRNTTTTNAPTDIILTANPFNNPSAGDFSLNVTSGGGALLLGAGWQSTIF